jgi:hypothetical protein
MSDEMLPYPIPILLDGVNVSGVAAHFAGLKAEPPPQLKAAWYVIVFRRMAGQNVDAECAELLHLERQHNAGKLSARVDPVDAPETAARRAFRVFKESQGAK